MLRSLLGLPDRTAIPALYILTGMLPIPRVIDQKQLVFLHSLISTEGRLKELVHRQYVVKTKKSKSWVVHMKTVLWEYTLPSIPDLLDFIEPKVQWKTTVKREVVQKAAEEIEEEAKSKSTLNYLNPQFQLNKCHNVIKYIRSPREVKRACIKAHMLTGTYMLEATRCTYGQVAKDTCQLCGEGAENLVHCLLQCSATIDVRNEYMPRVLASVPCVSRNLPTVLNCPKLLTQMIMDGTHPLIAELQVLPVACEEILERVTRSFCFAIHMRRSTLLCLR